MRFVCKKRASGAVALFVLILVVVAVLLRAAILKYQYYFGMYHDDGVYLVSAQSLAQGLGYRILSLPGEPFQTKYPIGYPFILSLALRLCPAFPANLVALETLQTIISALAILISVAYLISTRKVTLRLGFVIAAATLLNMRFIDFAPMLMSDLPSALLAAVCMWCAESHGRRRGSYAPWTALWLVAAVSMRTQAIILIPSLIIYHAARKQLKSIVPILLAAVAFIAPQLWWQSQFSNGTPEILTFYTNYLKHAYGTLPPAAAGFAAGSGNFHWSMILQINTYFPGLEQIPYEKLPPLAFFLLYSVLYYLLAVPSLTGLFILLRRASLPALYCFFYGLSFSVWPIKLEWRHILPVIVFGYYFYFVGFRFWFFKLKVFTKLSAPKLHKIGVCASLLFACYLVIGAGLLSCAKAGWSKVLAYPAEPETFSDFRDTVAWVKENTPPDSVFVCNNDPVFYLYTGRHAIMPSRMELWRFVEDRYVDTDSLRKAIDFSHADYVVNEPAYRSSGFSYIQLGRVISDLQRLRPGSFPCVFESKEKLVRVFKVE
ncbi:MAG: hypothetical protein JST44_19190 [Cyanobacteria bacterium SZAS LIN-5]|nr:hypothetical protein [Cyanobacteria bacterium SZAS LIN-5]